jgi:hypothetical protein
MVVLTFCQIKNIWDIHGLIKFNSLKDRLFTVMYNRIMKINGFTPAPIVLMGSGETSPSSGAVFEEVAKQYSTPLRIAILETPAGFELNSDRVAGRVGDFLKNRLQNYHPIIDIIPARKKGTEFSPDSEEILEPLYWADMIFMGPGSPTYAARQLMGSLAYEIIQARQRTGATLVLASAATIAFGCQTMPVYEIYKAGCDLHWQPGLDFFQNYGLSLIVVPHWNNAEGGAELDTSHCFMGKERFNSLAEKLTCKGNILGIDEHTSLWIDPGSGKGKVFGKGIIHFMASGQEHNYSTGEDISLNKLGDYVLPDDWQNGIPQSVWQRLSHYGELTSGDYPMDPPDEVLALIHQRDAVRKTGNFMMADQLRKRVEELGWRILDTPAGSKPVKD